MFPYIVFFGNKMGMFPLCAGIALLAIPVLIRYQLKSELQRPDYENKVMIAIPFSMLAGVVTAYLSDVLFRGGWTALTNPRGFGFTFYGWLIGCTVFYWIYGKLFQINPLILLNLFLPTFSLAQAIGRIGCFCGGCCYGFPSAFLGIKFPPGSLPYQKYGATPLIPVQLIESSYLFLLFLLLFLKTPFDRRAGLYLILMPAGRFLLEFLRGDDRGSICGFDWLSPSQILSLCFFATGILLLIGKQQAKEHIKNG